MTIRVVYKTKDERMQITFEEPGVEMVVTRLAEIQDVLENTRCEACEKSGREDTYGTVLSRRVAKGYTFYASKCRNPECGAELAISKHVDDAGGGLYTKRQQGKKDPTPGAAIENNGWTWYRKEDQAPQQQPTLQPAAPPASSLAPPVDESDIPF